jgi:hypothetical protein
MEVRRPVLVGQIPMLVLKRLKEFADLPLCDVVAVHVAD